MSFESSILTGAIQGMEFSIIDTRVELSLCSANIPSHSKFHPTAATLAGCVQLLEIIVDEKSAVIVALQPMVEVNLIEVGGDQFFPKFMSFGA